jgi:hypothetical protein
MYVTKQVMFLSFLCVFGGLSVKAQSPKGSSSDKGQPEIQSFQLEFGSPEMVKGVGPSPLIAVPFQCLADGTIFLDALDPNKQMKPTLYALLNGKVATFSPDGITDLANVQMIDYFPQPSSVFVLVRASRKAATQSDTDAATADHRGHYFIASFNRDGTYRSSIQLPITYPLFRFAVLSSGDFVLAGYDSAADEERLVLLDDRGTLLKVISPAIANAERAQRRNSSADQRMLAGAQSSGLTNFIGFKDSVLEWRTGTSDPIIEIHADGSTREVPIVLPGAGVLADILPSDDKWVAHVQPASTSTTGPRNLLTYSYYELSPLDGGVLRKLIINNNQVGTMACKNNGKYFAFSTDLDKKLVESVATDR